MRRTVLPRFAWEQNIVTASQFTSLRNIFLQLGRRYTEIEVLDAMGLLGRLHTLHIPLPRLQKRTLSGTNLDFAAGESLLSEEVNLILTSEDSFQRQHRLIFYAQRTTANDWLCSVRSLAARPTPATASPGRQASLFFDSNGPLLCSAEACGLRF